MRLIARSQYLPLAAVLWAAAFSKGSANAAVLYDNGPYNGHSQALPIYSNSNYVGDTFTIGSSATATGVEFVAWDYPATDTTTTVDWAIYNGTPAAPYGVPTGSLIVTGTSAVNNSFLFNNASGYGIYSDTFAIPSTALTAGTYTLVLANALTSPSGDIVRWDVNYGPSTAFYYNGFAPGFAPSESFQILGTVANAVPEPAAFALFGFGLAGIAVARRARRG